MDPQAPLQIAVVLNDDPEDYPLIRDAYPIQPWPTEVDMDLWDVPYVRADVLRRALTLMREMRDSAIALAVARESDDASVWVNALRRHTNALESANEFLEEYE